MFNFNYDTAPISGVMIANTNQGLHSIANTNGVVMCLDGLFPFKSHLFITSACLHFYDSACKC